MRILLAPDSFKESLSAAEAAAAMEAGFREGWPEATLECVPMADGGEGTLAAMAAGADLVLHDAVVAGPLGLPVCARFGMTRDAQTALIEMASASGLERVPLELRDPMLATSFGTGELIACALAAGARRFIVTLGGSATVDAGAGMLQALGVRLLDEQGLDIGQGGRALLELKSIDIESMRAARSACRFEAVCDVDNPLLGSSGAATVFGPQKGATADDVAELERALHQFADVVQADLGIDIAGTRGGGAAGGAGAALIGVLGASMRPGVEVVAEMNGLEAAIERTDLVVTGEGRFDTQTMRGKTVAGVAAMAKKHGKPVLVLAGGIDVDPGKLAELGISAAFSIAPGIVTREEAFSQASRNLRNTARHAAALLRLAGGLRHSSWAERT